MLGKDKVLCKTNSVQNKHNLYYKRIFRCIRGPAKSQMTFDLQTILVQDQTFHLYNHAQEVIQLLALKYVQLTISLLGTGEDLRTCCLNVSSLGGSLTKVEYLTVSNFTRNLFRSIWHRFDFPFGSYSLDISFQLRSTESSMSEHSIRDKSLN